MHFLKKLYSIKSLSHLLYLVYWRMGNECIQWNRVVMNDTTSRWINQLNPGELEALELSGNSWEEFNFRSYNALHYPDFDICKKKTKEKYDIIIAEQVFEHLLWPYRAGKNVFSMLKPGGYFLITLPFLIRVHHCPVDCTRWTELGLKHFLAECGFTLDDIIADSWGNRQFLKAHAEKGEVPYYVKYIHSLKNEKLYPASIWAMAKKNKTDL